MTSLHALARAQLLIVEDDPAEAEELRKNLQPYFSLVMVAADASQARSLLQGSSAFHAVLCQQRLAGGTGLGLLKWLRGTLHSPLPFILIADRTDRLRLDDPAADILTRPFSYAQALETLCRFPVRIEVGPLRPAASR